MKFLPLVLRSVDFNKGSFRLLLLEPLQGDSVKKPRTGAADIVIQPEKEVTLGPKTWKVRPIVVTHFLGEDVFWFESEQPKRLVRWLRFNGAEYELLKQK